MSDWNYAEVADRLEADQLDPETDYPAIMALLAFEVQPHARLGWACRPGGDSRWQSLPSFRSADDADLWLRNAGGYWNDIGRNADGTLYAGYEHPDFGNDYGNSSRLGTAMWAAWLRLVAKVPAE